MNSFHAVSPHSLTHSTLSSSQIHFPRSHTGWNTLWWSYLTSRGWPNCKEVRGVTLRPQSICSYRIFVNVLAARENELAFSAARHVAGGCRAAGSLYLLYRRCEASTSYMRARSRRKHVLSVHFIPSLINGERSGKGMHLTSNSKEKKREREFPGSRNGMKNRQSWWSSCVVAVKGRLMIFFFPPFSPLLLELMTADVKGSSRSENGRPISALFHPQCFPGKGNS